MQAAPGSISWVAAQPSVLGRCGGGGGAPSASVKGRAFAGGGGAGGGGGGGCVRGVGLVRCSARAQEKRPPRVRKSKEERREMVESFINRYRTPVSQRCCSRFMPDWHCPRTCSYSLATVARCCIMVPLVLRISPYLQCSSGTDCVGFQHPVYMLPTVGTDNCLASVS
jgi:hypothetical protein